MADLNLSSLSDRKPVRLEKNGESICVTRIGSEVFAINDVCSQDRKSTRLNSSHT